MSALFKGRQNASLVSEEPAFDAETGARQFDQTFAGSKDVIYGLARSFEEDNLSYRISNQGPVYSIVVRVPEIDATQELLDRYEISTESEEKSIFEHPSVIVAAAEWDTGPGALLSSFKKLAEDAADDNSGYSLASASISAETQATFQSVVRHLRSKAVGYQIDFITLRRFRQIDITYAYSGGRFNLDDGSRIYSTAQLNLPASVAFSLPATPSDPSADYSWGWKRRGQRVEIVGTLIEQTVELVFAPWSTLLYENATGNLNW